MTDSKPANLCKCGHPRYRHNPTHEWCWKCRACAGFRAQHDPAGALLNAIYGGPL